MQGLEVDFERKEGINYFKNSPKKTSFYIRGKRSFALIFREV